MATIGLIAAMAQESDVLLRRFKGWKRVAVGSLSGKRCEPSGGPACRSPPALAPGAVEDSRPGQARAWHTNP